MAKVLKDYQFHTGFGHGNGEVLPISDWADGKIRELTRGEDFQCSTITLQVKLRKYAKQQGLKVRISAKRDGDSAIVQFTTPEEMDDRRLADQERKRLVESPVSSVDGKAVVEPTTPEPTSKPAGKGKGKQ